VKAAGYLLQAIRSNFMATQLFLAETLLWDRADVPEDADELVGPRRRPLEHHSALVENDDFATRTPIYTAVLVGMVRICLYGPLRRIFQISTCTTSVVALDKADVLSDANNSL